MRHYVGHNCVGDITVCFPLLTFTLCIVFVPCQLTVNLLTVSDLRADDLVIQRTSLVIQRTSKDTRY